MQYLLTEEEMRGTISKYELELMTKRRDRIVELLVKECVHIEGCTFSYCESCPLGDLDRIYDVKGGLCGRSRRYSK